MALFELSHFSGEKPLYEEGFILLPHLATLALCILPGGEITDIYSYFVSSALHLISSQFLGLGGIYHGIFGPERLEERTYAFLFGYQLKDRFRITAILGAHLGTLGSLALFLFRWDLSYVGKAVAYSNKSFWNIYPWIYMDGGSLFILQ